VVARGELWWVELGDPHGSRPAGRRPVLIVSSDPFNRSKINTVLTVVVTSNVRLAGAPGNVLLGAGTAGLARDSVANVSQVVTLNKNELAGRIGRLGAPLMRQVDAGLRRALDL